MTSNVEELGKIILENVQRVESGKEGAADVFFFAVELKPDSMLAAEELVTLTQNAEEGFYGNMSLDTLKGGPSYIHLGSWLGDQGLALMYMGLLKLLGLADIVSPVTLGMSREEAEPLVGTGFLFVVPSKDSQLLITPN